jgi:hypothetical protein
VLAGLGFEPGAWKLWVVHASFVSIASVTSFLSLLHVGGYPNTLLPAYAALAVAFGIGIAALLRRGPGVRSHPGGAAFGLAALSLQLLLLRYEPSAALPSEQDRIAGQRVVAELGRLPRPLWVTSSSHYPVLAGQEEGFAPTMGIMDVLRVPGQTPERLRRHLTDQIRAGRFKTIVLDRAAGFLPPDLVHEIRQRYRFAGRLFRSSADASFWPKSGAAVRPDEIWRLPDAPAPPN